MKGKLRAVSVIAALVVLLIVAISAGFCLAVWDTESSVSEVFSLASAGKSNVVIAQKQTIEIEDKDLSSLKTDSLTADGKGKIDGDITSIKENGGISQIANSKPENVEDKAEESEEEQEEELQEKEKTPLRITAEISGIATVVRAGDAEAEVVNEIPIPQAVAASEAAQNIDPLADYPLPYTEVDGSYFDDALFIGDSRVAGLAMNSGTNATFFAVTSFQLYKYKTFKVVQTSEGKVPIFDAMPYDRFTKIYIKVGLNELGSVTDEPFLNCYKSFIEELRMMQPRAIIYIQAILPVTQVKSQTDRVHCNENITKRNANLKSFAELMKCYYVDAGPYFADETGALKAETTADGIHMYSKYMPQWIDALRQQAVVWPPVQ